jgi:hypothetical protein
LALGKLKTSMWRCPEFELLTLDLLIVVGKTFLV